MSKEKTISIATYVEDEDKSELFVLKKVNMMREMQVRPCHCSQVIHSEGSKDDTNLCWWHNYVVGA